MAFTILRTAKLRTYGSIAASAEHTYRERPTPNADLTRTPQNENLGAQSSAELVAAVRSRVALAERQAKDPVLCIEYLITASPEAFARSGGHLADKDKYFDDALRWLQKKHGMANVVASSLQLDEKTPHLVAYVVPLVQREASTRKRSVIVGKDADGKPIRETREFHQEGGISLSAKEYLGGRQKLTAMQTDFAQTVGKPHQLERGIEGSRANHLRVKQHYSLLEQASQPVAIEAKDVAPRKYNEPTLWGRVCDFIGYKRWIETPEGVAERLSADVRRATAPAAEKAAIAEQERRRVRDLARTLQQQQARAKTLQEQLQGLRQGVERMARAILAGGAELEAMREAARKTVAAQRRPQERGRGGPDRGGPERGGGISR